jgi:hypothetical protein
LSTAKADRIRIPSGYAPAPALAATTGGVYVAQAEPNVGGNGALLSIANDSQEPVKIADSEGRIGAIAFTSANVYFADDGGIKSVPILGGRTQTVAKLTAGSLLVMGDTLYASVIEQGVYALSLQTGHEAMFDSDPLALELTDCGQSLCWLSGAALDGRIVRRALIGDASEILASGLSEPHDLAFDTKNLFVSTGAFGLALMRLPSSGGQVDTIWGGGATNLAANEHCLYWSTKDLIYDLSVTAADVIAPL